MAHQDGRKVKLSRRALYLRSNLDRVACPEVCERLGHATWVLHLQPVRGTWEDESLDMRQPGQQQTVRFPETVPEGVTLAA